ncbi:uncharacterized protein BXZ73DRAFT_107066 [Epithele typhae]|uniref:uncharacterized protein n=1 Tax=Epithele typhae TaxID=378194 RepID=UPI002008E80D|nr:uncharacterized protein BXZ73DRAFT_107066 [Epithele typhae]KAH9913089.1 hypothetical protein BXZ73DRAFT_107066 [Epithele typhae]
MTADVYPLARSNLRLSTAPSHSQICKRHALKRKRIDEDYFNHPSPRPLRSNTGLSRSMYTPKSPPVLNTDILAEFLLHLPPYDALIYGSTCYFLRDRAVRQAVSNVRFASAPHLTKFCLFMLADLSRMPYLRHLTLLRQVAHAPTEQFLASIASLAHLLPHATALATLILPDADLWLGLEARLIPALVSLPCLKSLDLHSLGDDTQSALSRLCSAETLQRLVVDSQWVTHPPEGSVTSSMHLPVMPNLHTLVLTRCQNPPPRNILPTLFPALRVLQLTEVSYPPSQSEVSPRSWWLPPDSPPAIPSEEPEQGSLDVLCGDIPSLRSLQISRPVRALELNLTLTPEHPADPEPLAEVFGAASPRRLALRMTASCELPFWRLYAPEMPRLRYLELVVIDDGAIPPEHASWLDALSTPGCSSLFALAIDVRSFPNVQTGVGPPVETAGARPNDPARVLACLLRALPGALPNLCLLALRVSASSCPIDSEPVARGGGPLGGTFAGSADFDPDLDAIGAFDWWAAEARLPRGCAQDGGQGNGKGGGGGGDTHSILGPAEGYHTFGIYQKRSDAASNLKIRSPWISFHAYFDHAKFGGSLYSARELTSLSSAANYCDLAVRLGFIPRIALRVAAYLETSAALWDADPYKFKGFQDLFALRKTYRAIRTEKDQSDLKYRIKIVGRENMYRCAAPGCGIQSLHKRAFRMCTGRCFGRWKSYYCSAECQHNVISEDDGDPDWVDVGTYDAAIYRVIDSRSAPTPREPSRARADGELFVEFTHPYPRHPEGEIVRVVSSTLPPRILRQYREQSSEILRSCFLSARLGKPKERSVLDGTFAVDDRWWAT